MIGFEIIGLRDTMGRFASMRNGGLAAIQMAAAAEAEKSLTETFKSLAPYGHQHHGQPETRGGEGHFRDSIEGHLFGGGTGFYIEIDTNLPIVREWLLTGTSAHGPAVKRVMVFEGDAGVIHTRWVSGMSADPWEEEADAAAMAEAEVTLNVIGARVVAGLSG